MMIVRVHLQEVEKKKKGGEGGIEKIRSKVNERAKACGGGRICQLIRIPFRSTNPSSISCIIHAYLFLIEIPWPRKEAGGRRSRD